MLTGISVVFLFVLSSTTADKVNINKFYSDDSIAQWKAVLGDDMHYHHGVFSSEALASPSAHLSDEEIDGAMTKAVSMLYQYIGQGTTVLDIGSGWCGPMKQLKDDLGCTVTGVTVSESQHAHCTTNGHDVALADIEDLLTSDNNNMLDAKYDVALMLESITHVEDKHKLLNNLLSKTNKLVIRANTYEGEEDSKVVFGDSMQLLSLRELRDVMEESGWRVVHSENIRQLTQPTLRAYQQRFGAKPNSSTSQLAVLWDLVQHQTDADRDSSEFVRDTWQLQHGLFDIVAVPMVPNPSNNMNNIDSVDESVSLCGESLRSMFAQSRDFLRSVVDVEALGTQPTANGVSTTITFDALFECVVDVISATSQQPCPDAHALGRQLLLPSVKVSNMSLSSSSAIINRNRYAIFLDASTLGAPLQHQVVSQCAAVIGIFPTVKANVATMPADAVAVLGVEWPAPFSAQPATGRFYFQSGDEFARISSWEWALTSPTTTTSVGVGVGVDDGVDVDSNGDGEESNNVIHRSYDRHHDTTTDGCDWQRLGGEVLDSDKLVDLTHITACYTVKRGTGDANALVSKFDLKLEHATVDDVLPLLKGLSPHARESVMSVATRGMNIPLIGVGQDMITLYLSVADINDTTNDNDSGEEEDGVVMATKTTTTTQPGCVSSPSHLVNAPLYPPPTTMNDNAAAGVAGVAVGVLTNVLSDASVFGSKIQVDHLAPTDFDVLGDVSIDTIANAVDVGLPASVGIVYKQNTKSIAGPATFTDFVTALNNNNNNNNNNSSNNNNNNNTDALSAIIHNVHDLVGLERLRAFKQDLESMLRVPVSVNMYLSSAQGHALPAHTDRYDVFVMQLEGTKSWELCVPIYVGLTDADACALREIATHNPGGCSKFTTLESKRNMSCSTVQLTAGDVLYMPKGVVHSAVATTKSTHLTIGVIRKGLTWKSLMEETITKSTTSATLEKEILAQVQTLSQATPAGVAWQRALPMWLLDQSLSGKTSHGVDHDVLHSHFIELAQQLKQQLLLTPPALGWAAVDATNHRYDAAIEALTRVDSINTAVFALNRRARDLVQTYNTPPGSDTSATALFDGDVYANVTSLSRRAENWGRDCWSTQASGKFVCHEYAKSDVKNRQYRSAIKEGCDCDGYYGSSCDCDTSGHFAQCRVPCDQCSSSCAQGLRFTGCGPAFDAYIAGKCVPNEPGDFCSPTNPNQICKAGQDTCKGGACCLPNVNLANCHACEQSDLGGGACIEWKTGYTGKYANTCANGFGPMVGNSCPRKSENGEICATAQNCAGVGTECKGGRCCNSAASSESNCVQCSSTGACTSCSGNGRDPSATCNDCQPNFFKTMVSDVFQSCTPLLREGATCGANEECISDDCRTQRCCQSKMNGDKQCIACNTQGLCEECAPGYSVNTYTGMCHKQCLGFLYNNKEDIVTSLFDHGDVEYQWRWASTNSNNMQTCEELRYEYQRTCVDGDWDQPDFVLRNDVFQHQPKTPPTSLSCTNNCRTPLGFRVFVCERNMTLAALVDDVVVGTPAPSPQVTSACAQTLDASALASGEFCDFKPVMGNGEFAARILYEKPFVSPGGKCTASVQLEECIGEHFTNRGGLSQRVVSRVLVTEPEQIVNSCVSGFNYVSCYENCAVDCTREMEIDDTVCYDECNVVSCGFQRGHCADMLQDNLTDAQMYALSQDTTDTALDMAITICELVSDDSVQRTIIKSACWLAQSVTNGFDLYGRNKSYVYPLAWEEYGKLVSGGGNVGGAGYVGLLEVYEKQVEDAEDDLENANNRNKLMEKISLLSMDIGDASQQIKGLRADSQSFEAEVVSTMAKLSDAQQHEFREMRRELGSLWLSQRDIGGAIAMTRETLLEADRESVIALTTEMRTNTETITDAIEEAKDDIIRGQGAIFDQVIDNGIQLRYIREQVDRIRATQLDMQEQMITLVASFRGAHAEVKQQQNVATRFYQRFNPDVGLPKRQWIYKTFDLDGDGVVSFVELMALFDDFDIISAAGVSYYETAVRYDEQHINVTTKELFSIVSQTNFEARAYVRQQTLISEATMANSDLNKDGTIDGMEAFNILATYSGISTETAALFELWKAEGSGGAAWKRFGCLAREYIDIMMERESTKFSLKATINLFKKVTGLIDAIKQLADLLASTLKECFDAVGNVLGIIGGIFSGNIGAVIDGVQGAVGNIPKCIDGIKDMIADTVSDFTRAKIDILDLKDMVVAAIKLIDNFLNPPQFKSQCEATLAIEMRPKLPPMSFSTIGFAERDARDALDQLDDLVKISNGTNATHPDNSTLPSNATNLIMTPLRIANMRSTLMQMFGLSMFERGGVDGAFDGNHTLTYVAESMRFVESSVDHAEAINSWYVTARSSEELKQNNEILKAYIDRADQSQRMPSEATVCKTPFKLPLRSEICIQDANDPDTREPRSLEREYQLRQRVPMQRQREVIQRLLELVYKEKRQLEFKWLEEVDTELPGLKAEDFRWYQNYLHSWNQQRIEEAAGTQGSQSRVAYTFFKEDFTAEFAKLGSTRSFTVRNATGNHTVTVPELLELPIDAPQFSQYYGTYYTDVRVFLLPSVSTTEDVLSVQLMKEGNSLFFREDGDMRNAERFQHEPQVWGDLGYFTSDCQPAGTNVLLPDKIRYSPYGVWKLMVNPDFKDTEALKRVTSIKFEFTVHTRRSTSVGVSDWPLFANDRVQPDSVQIVRTLDDSKCTMFQPLVPFGVRTVPSLTTPLTTNASNTPTSTNPNTDTDTVATTIPTVAPQESTATAMTGGTIGGIVIALVMLIIIVLVVAVFVLRKKRTNAASFAYEEDRTGVDNPAYGIGGISDMLRMDTAEVVKKGQELHAPQHQQQPSQSQSQYPSTPPPSTVQVEERGTRDRANTIYHIPTEGEDETSMRGRKNTIYHIPTEDEDNSTVYHKASDLNSATTTQRSSYVDVEPMMFARPTTATLGKNKTNAHRYPRLESNDVANAQAKAKAKARTKQEAKSNAKPPIHGRYIDVSTTESTTESTSTPTTSKSKSKSTTSKSTSNSDVNIIMDTNLYANQVVIDYDHLTRN